MTMNKAKKIGLGVIAATIAGTGIVSVAPELGMFQTLEAHASEQFGDFTYSVNSSGTGINILDYSGSGGDVVIPSEIESLPVTVLSSYSLANANLRSVVIPDTVEMIGSRSFTNNNNLTKVTMSKNVKNIGYMAFSGAKIREIELPESLVEIGNLAFSANNLKKVVFKGAETTIAGDSFQGNFPVVELVFYAPNPSIAKAYAENKGFIYLPYVEPEAEEPEIPTNPDDSGPSDPVEDQTHENKATFNLFGGVFDLMTAPIISFGNITMPTETTTYHTGFDGVFKVRDLRGTQEGWRVDVSATPFQKVEPEGGFAEGTEDAILPAGTLSLNPVHNITRTSDNTGGMPTSELDGSTIIDDGSVTVVRAEVGSGAGEYDLEFPENALELNLDPSTIEVDKANYPNGGTPYEATITWDLIQAP